MGSAARVVCCARKREGASDEDPEADVGGEGCSAIGVHQTRMSANGNEEETAGQSSHSYRDTATVHDGYDRCSEEGRNLRILKAVSVRKECRQVERGNGEEDRLVTGCPSDV